jgi:hypothetical protein
MCPVRRYSENNNPEIKNPLNTKNSSTPDPPIALQKLT